MLLVDLIRKNPEEVKRKLAKKHFKQLEIVDEIISLDAKRKKIQTNLDDFLSQRNAISKEIGSLMQSGQKELAENKKNEISTIKENTLVLEADLKIVEETLFNQLVTLPNLPTDLVPEGKTPEENVCTFVVRDIPVLGDEAKPHWELTEKYDIVDFELGVKLTGAGFPVYKGKGAILQRALISFFLDEAGKAGYNEVIPPLMVNEESAFATGQLPDKEGQMYHVTEDKFYLIPTAEVPITNILRGELLKESQLPVKYTGYTPCFRREAGSYGKDVRGLNRLHQFDKVEIVQAQHPDKSYETLDEMVKHVENLLIKLELPYRILRLCGGDMSFASALTYDFEAYSGAQKKWLEVSSVSNFETFQSNRLKLRFKNADGQNVLAHTLNGSALALPRIVACLLENNQTPEGIKIPAVLQKYTGFDMIN
jgi:seryl-tRNA synthetase